MEEVKKSPISTAGLLLVSVVGFILSFLSLYNHYHVRLAEGDGPSSFCDINQQISCSAVELSQWSQLMGVPLASFGVLFFGIVIISGALLSTSRFSSVCVLLGSIGTACSIALFFISSQIIGALCLLCVGTYLSNLFLLIIGYFGSRKQGFFKSLASGLVSLTALVLGPVDRGNRFVSVVSLSVLVAISFYVAPLLFITSIESPSVHDLSGAARQIEKEADAAGFVSRPPVDLSLSTDKSVDTEIRDFTLGNADAPVQIVEFSDFQCPACSNAFSHILNLMRKYPGKIQFVFKNFPLDKSCNSSIQRDMHQYACTAATLARCAGEQGQFAGAAQLLFSGKLFPQTLVQDFERTAISFFEQRLKVDPQKMETCMASGRHEGRIKEDIEKGLELGLTGTPMIFLNGREITRGDDIDDLVEALAVG